MIVVDTNVVATVMLDDDRTAVGRRVLARDAAWVVPRLLRSELRSVFALHVRHRGAPPDAILVAEQVADVLLAPRECPVDGALVLTLAMASGCTAYDCEFVALAQALDVPLVTWDRALLRHFPGCAVAPEEFVEGV